ncbi:MAG: hypothetical protein K2L07_10595 [Lachnospiraceae bacterium]|nr:hypothetical protein [Lachnospiraceae bacterium]
MDKKMTREELIQLVEQIMKCEGTEQELDDLIFVLKKNVIDPQVTNYIYYDDLTPEQVVDKALSYKPILL